MKTLITLAVVVVLVITGVVGYLLYPEINTLEKQIEKAEDLNLGGAGPLMSTTTSGTTIDPYTLKTQSGTLGSIIITQEGTGFDLYDATTTDVVSGNAARAATTTLLLAHFEPSAAADVGVYEFNTAFVNGLLIDFVAEGAGYASTTITWE